MKQLFRITLMNFVATLSLLFALSAPVAAANQPLTQFAACQTKTLFGLPSWDACLPRGNDGEIKINKLNDLWLIAFPIVESMIKVAGYVAVGFIIWGGFKFIKSQGDPSQITVARDTVRDAVIGLVISVLSVAIVQFVASRF